MSMDIIEDAPEAEGDEEDNDSIGLKPEMRKISLRPSQRRRRAFTLTSYKVDNNPEAVEHLAKTLG